MCTVPSLTLLKFVGHLFVMQILCVCVCLFVSVSVCVVCAGEDRITFSKVDVGGVSCLAWVLGL